MFGIRISVERICNYLASFLTSRAIIFTLEIPRFIGISLFNEQFLSIMLGLSILIAFMRSGFIANGNMFWRYGSLITGLAGLACCLVISVIYPALFSEMIFKPWYGIFLSIILILCVLEGTRRQIGVILVAVIVAFILYALFSSHIPGIFNGRSIDLIRLFIYLGVDSNAIFGSPLLVTCTIVISFVFMGQIMSAGSAGDFFRDFALSLLGKHRGGAGKVSIFSSLLFGTISGSAVGNVVSTGVLTIKIMKNGGFSARNAGAIEAVASTGGQLVPPVMGATAFLIAEFLQVSYGAVALAAIVPAALYFFSLWITIDCEAARDGLKTIPPDQIPRICDVIKKGWHVPIPMFLLAFSLFVLNYSPQISAIIAAVAFAVLDLMFGYGEKRTKISDLRVAFPNTGQSVVELVLVAAAAGIIIGVLSITGLGFTITIQLTEVANNSIILLLILTATGSIILGAGMPTIAIYVLLATLMGSALEQSGIDPIAAHLFIMYFGMLSMITPPVALASFAAATIARAPMFSTALASMRIGWTAYFIPFVFVYEPGLLLRGDISKIIIIIIIATAGVYSVTSGLSGWFLGKIDFARRTLLVLGGLALLFPAHTTTFGLTLNVFGGIVFVVLLIEALLTWKVSNHIN